MSRRSRAATPGPHVLVNALTHGNEICGALALDQLFKSGLRPACRQDHPRLRQCRGVSLVRPRQPGRVALCRRGFQPALGQGHARRPEEERRARTRAAPQADLRKRRPAPRPSFDAACDGAAHADRARGQDRRARAQGGRAGAHGARQGPRGGLAPQGLRRVRRAGRAAGGAPGRMRPALGERPRPTWRSRRAWRFLAATGVLARERAAEILAQARGAGETHHRDRHGDDRIGRFPLQRRLSRHGSDREGGLAHRARRQRRDPHAL